MIEAVLWDLDGTLVSTKRLYLEAYRRALAPYIGRAMPDEEILACRPRSELRFLRAHASDRLEACLSDFRRHYAELHATHFDGIYPGVLDTLDGLRARGLKLGLVSGKSRSSYEVMLAAADLGPFDVMVLDDDVEEPKPSPEGILLALERLGISGERVLYVGDSMSDIDAALAARTHAAGVLWSKANGMRSAFAEFVRGAGGVVLSVPSDTLLLEGLMKQGPRRVTGPSVIRCD